MFQINSNTTQKDLISTLLGSLAGQGNLYIQVLSLPYFLSSITSIKVFQYKIQNYPRSIFWYSNDNRISEFLSNSSLNVGSPAALVAPNCQTETYHKTNPTIIPSTSKKPKITKDEIIALNGPHHKDPEPYNFSHPSLLDEFRKKQFNQESKPDFKQDLDKWLKKIETTKEALSKHSFESQQQKSYYGRLFENFDLFGFLQSKLILRSAISLGVIVIIGNIFLSYPKNVYKLEVSSTNNQKAIDTTFPISNLTKSTIKLNTSAETAATGIGQDILTNTRSIGKVLLVNNSQAKVDFAKEGLILIAESTGNEYRHKALSSEPATLSVASKNTQIGQRMEINIQATQPGKQFELPVNAVFRVYNLNGQAMGSSFRAIASTEISTKTQADSQERIVTEDDASLLRSKVESEFLTQKNNQFSTLRESNQITNPQWIKVSQPSYNYSNQIGSKADSTSITATANADIYSIPKDNLTKHVQNLIPSKDILDITIVESKIDDTNVTAKLFVTYNEPAFVDSSNTPSILKNKDFAQAKIDLQSQYPSVKRVSQEFQGINFPMIAPIDKVEITNIQK